MGTTTKMAIPYPESTGFVKDGWEDMKDIATQVDAKSGLVLIATNSFSAVSSVSLANNTFSSNYQNYRLVINLTTSASVEVYWRGRTAGSDNSTGNYDWRAFYNDRTTLAVNTGSNNTTSGILSDSGSNATIIDCDIYNPFDSKQTIVLSKGWGGFDDSSYFKSGNSQFDETTSFDSMTWFPVSGTMTGSYSVFGYNK